MIFCQNVSSVNQLQNVILSTYTNTIQHDNDTVGQSIVGIHYKIKPLDSA